MCSLMSCTTKQGSGQRAEGMSQPLFNTACFLGYKPSLGRPHFGQLVQREPATWRKAASSLGPGWSKPVLHFGGGTWEHPCLQRLQEGRQAVRWPQGTGGHTATLGVFLKTKHQGEGRRRSLKAQRFLQLMQNQSTPQHAAEPASQGDDRWCDSRVSRYLLGQEEDKPLYFLFCSFISASADPEDQPATL